jgi:hypothetical protein
MAHKPEIVAWKQLSDNTIAFLARCCGDARTDSWHTVHNLHEFENAEIEREANQHLANVEAKHAHAERILAHVKTTFPAAKQHDGDISNDKLHTTTTSAA